MGNPLTVLSFTFIRAAGWQIFTALSFQIRADKWELKIFWPKLGPAFVYNERVFQKGDGVILPGPIFLNLGLGWIIRSLEVRSASKVERVFLPLQNARANSSGIAPQPS
jgi:hypothetical protein